MNEKSSSAPLTKIEQFAMPIRLSSLQLRNGMTIKRATGATYSSIHRTSARGSRFLGILAKWEGAPSSGMAKVVGRSLTFSLKPRERVEVVAE